MNLKKIKMGFSLFELLVSISIIGILVALVSISYSSAQKKSRDARRMQDINAIQKAAEQFYSFSSYVYPTTTTGAWVAGNGSTVLAVFPQDPKNTTGGTVYTYVPTGNTQYCVCAGLESATGNSLDANCNFNGVGNTGPFFCARNQQ